MAGRFDVAQICLNGHVINNSAATAVELNQEFCDRCGEKVVSHCASCNAEIRGSYHPIVRQRMERRHASLVRMVSVANYKVPAFCPECGKPYPWTGARITAAKELAEEQEALNQEEKEQLKKSIEVLVRETPEAPVAGSRFKRLVKKAGGAAAEGFKTILTDIVSEAIKKTMGF